MCCFFVECMFCSLLAHLEIGNLWIGMERMVVESARCTCVDLTFEFSLHQVRRVQHDMTGTGYRGYRLCENEINAMNALNSLPIFVDNMR